MLKRIHLANAGLGGLLVLGASATQLTGCEDLPGGRKEQATVIGGASGAAIGAILAEDNRLLGALIGGAIGAGAGYIIGAETDWFEDDDDDHVENEVNNAAQRAQYDPATVAEARAASDADINDDGFVTLDEVIAMEQAGFTDREMLDRLEVTGHIFDLNASQRQHLLDNGVSRNVVDQMVDINRAERDRILSRHDDDVIGRDRDDDDMYDMD
jgi:hypothetical protein